MVELLEELEARYDLVIIDTPPALPVTDALLIAVNAGGTVVVTRLSHTHRNALMRTVDAVRKVNAHLVGIVGNAAVEKEERQYGYGYGYTYGYVDDTPANAEDLRPTEHIQAAGRRRPVASNGGTPAVFVPEPMPAPAAAAAPAPAPMHAVVEAPPNAPLSAPVSAPPSATVPEYPPEVVAYYRDALDRRISERAKAGLAEKSAMPDEAVSQPGDDG
jgi:hypothetical protein